MNKRIPLSVPTMHGEEMTFVKEAFDRNWIAPLGFNCDNFEKEMVEYLMADTGKGYHALALSSGTAALHLAMKLAGVKPGDPVLCSDMTFAATVNPVSYEGGVQVYVDSERETWNMDPEALELAFQKYPNAKVVVLVHLYGVPAKMDEIMEICARHGAIVVEDAAEALAASYKGRKCGTFGHYNAISFNGNKIITTSGGGMHLCEDENDARHALKLATQAREPLPYYQHEEIGYNYRISNICAGIGRGQIRVLGERVAKKRYICQKYKEKLSALPIEFQPELENAVSNRWLTSVLISKHSAVTPQDIISALASNDAEARHLWNPMHCQPVFNGAKFVSAEDDAVSTDLFMRGVCLPSDTKMSDADIDRICETIKSLF